MDIIDRLLQKVHKLNDIGIALSAEKDYHKLLEKILEGAKELTRADGGTLYTVTDYGKKLKFEIVRTDSLSIHWNAKDGVDESFIKVFPDIPIYKEGKETNDHLVVVCSVVHGKTINIADTYYEENFDLSGTKEFDKRTGYRTKSVLTVPMRNHEGEIIAVLQVINNHDPKTGEIIPFSEEDQELVESLASQAAIAMTNNNLIADLKEMLESLIKVLADAIDGKSKYTGKHCRRVPIIAKMIAEAVSNVNNGPLAKTFFTEEEIYELYVAALLHDCGKVTTPIYVVDKRNKLEAIFDRIHLIDTRFEVLKREEEKEFLKKKFLSLKGQVTEEDIAKAEADLCDRVKDLNDDRDFLRECNRGKEEDMPSDDVERVKKIADYKWHFDGKSQPFLTDDEVKNLCIHRGTLNDEERGIINKHVDMTIKMLSKLPYPTHLRRVPEIAGAHHEHLDGSGIPYGLTKDEMSLQARILALADIFEALTAGDRPYRSAFTLSKALELLKGCKDKGIIDPDVYDVFIGEKLYLRYGKEFLPSELIDVE